MPNSSPELRSLTPATVAPPTARSAHFKYQLKIINRLHCLAFSPALWRRVVDGGKERGVRGHLAPNDAVKMLKGEGAAGNGMEYFKRH